MTATFGSVPVTMAVMSEQPNQPAQQPTRRPWRTARLPEHIVGTKGACKILGIHKTTLNNWLEPGSGKIGPDKTYMIPPRRVWDAEGDVADGWPVWDAQDVYRFAAEIGRQRSPRGQAKSRRRVKDPKTLREQIAALQKQLAAMESDGE